MKARTKAAKIKAKRGRPKMDAIYREPNGRASRAKEPPAKVMLEARAKHLGVAVEVARDPGSSDYLGRLHSAYLRWKKLQDPRPPQPAQSISTAQYYGALNYLHIHNEFAKAVQSEAAIYEPRARSSGENIEAMEQWGRDARDSYEKLRNAIQTEQNYSRENLWAALDLCVIQGLELPYMVGPLRTLCNAINRHLKAHS